MPSASTTTAPCVCLANSSRPACPQHFFRNHASLSALHDISQSRLSPYLKTVVLGTELIPHDIYPLAKRGSANDCLRAYADQTSLCASASDRHLLYLSFDNLHNLDSLVVKEYEGGTLWNTADSIERTRPPDET